MADSVTEIEGQNLIIREYATRIPAGGFFLEADLHIPDGAVGIVAFAHGSGSGRHSPRNRFVAQVLQDSGLATLLLDLLTLDEECEDQRTHRLRFDVRLLADRVLAATDWLLEDRRTRDFRIGYFGASTGATAALIAAGERPPAVGAVVSRGGRPDLAGEALGHVTAPTLLIVGAEDDVVINLNRAAFEELRQAKTKELVLIPTATHLFEEPGTLEQVASLAKTWFAPHLTAARESTREKAQS
jgi:dienelactone hydrolase